MNYPLARVILCLGYLAGQRACGRDKLHHPSDEDLDMLLIELQRVIREEQMTHPAAGTARRSDP